MATAEARRSDCPVAFALDLFGDRWTLLVVRDLAFKGRTTFSDFMEGGERVATNILSDRLKRLQSGGVVERRRDRVDSRRVQYQLTDKGKDLVPMLVEMILWSAAHDPETAADPAFVRDANTDRDRLLRRLRSDVDEVPFTRAATWGGRVAGHLL